MPPIQRLKGAIAELRSAPSIAIIRPQPAEAQNKPPGRILVSIDVHELGPIELEVRLFQDVVGGRQRLGAGVRGAYVLRMPCGKFLQEINAKISLLHERCLGDQTQQRTGRRVETLSFAEYGGIGH